MSNSVLQKAFEIAKEELRACYDEFGIVAGRGHYEEYWTRDAAFGCLGALALDDSKIVEKHLNLLASFQRKDGMIPFLIRRFLPGLPFFGLKIKTKPRPKFRSHKALFLSEVIDSNAYFVIILTEFLKKRSNENLFAKYRPAVEKALEWYFRKMKGALVSEGPIAEWNDGVYKTGKTLITNVLVYQTFKVWEELCERYSCALKPEFIGLASKIKKEIQEKFWQGEYFSDWIDYKRHDYFDSNANFLAIIWGLAKKRQIGSIIDFALAHLADWPFIKLVFPAYPWWRIEAANRLFGMADYTDGNGLLWSDTTCLFTWTLAKTDTKEKALEFLAAFSKNIVKNKGIYEVYSSQDKKPLSRWNYKSEFPYARGAALFILAYEEIMNSKL